VPGNEVEVVARGGCCVGDAVMEDVVKGGALEEETDGEDIPVIVVDEEPPAPAAEEPVFGEVDEPELGLVEEPPFAAAEETVLVVLEAVFGGILGLSVIDGYPE
jgi:hypothetical protein